jgi:serine/threonine protein phosphatase 1
MTYTFAIGDIHGCVNQMRRMQDRIMVYAPSGTVVFLGDYIDRGPDSKAVLDILMGEVPKEWRWIALKGNHEDMMVQAIRDPRLVSWWIGNGGAETLVSFGGEIPNPVVSWCRRLPSYHIDDHRIFVHAGVKDIIPIEHQTDEEFLWLRVPPHYHGTYWGKHVVHGHTPSIKNPTTFGNRTNVDSGCVFDGRLSCAVFEDGVPGGPIDFIEVSA